MSKLFQDIECNMWNDNFSEESFDDLDYKIKEISSDEAKEIFPEYEEYYNNQTESFKKNTLELKNIIEKGNWVINGETIIIDNNNKLIDGKKRICACILSKKSIQTIIIYGLDNDVSITIDERRKRTLMNMMNISGYNNAYGQAITAFIRHFQTGRHVYSNQKISSKEAISFIEKNNKIVESFNFLQSLKRKSFPQISTGKLLGFHFLIRKIDEEKANNFYKKLLNTKREDFVTGDVCHELARRLNGDNDSNKDKILLLIRGWNIFYTNPLEKVFQFKIQKNDSIPNIQGWKSEFNVNFNTLSNHVEVKNSNMYDIKIYKKMINSEIALDLLKYNTGNRKPSKEKIEQIKRDIQNNKWVLNGQTIKKTKQSNGEIKIEDGQHRLLAISELDNNIFVPTIIVENLTPGIFSTIDEGSKKGFGDFLQSKNIKNSKNIASAINMLSIFINYDKNTISSNNELYDIYEKHDVTLHSEYVSKLKNLLPASYVLWLSYILFKDSPEYAKVFFDFLGENFSDDSEKINRNGKIPGILRRKIEDSKNIKTAYGSIEFKEIVPLFLKAWFYFKDGKQVEKFMKSDMSTEMKKFSDNFLRQFFTQADIEKLEEIE